jgi:hypothetical protein
LKIVEALNLEAKAANDRVAAYRDALTKLAQASDPFKLTTPFPNGNPAPVSPAA